MANKIKYGESLACCSLECKTCNIDCKTISQMSEKIESYSDYNKGLIFAFIQGTEKFSQNFLAYKNELHFSSNGELLKYLIRMHLWPNHPSLDPDWKAVWHYTYLPTEVQMRYIKGQAIIMNENERDLFNSIVSNSLNLDMELNKKRKITKLTQKDSDSLRESIFSITKQGILFSISQIETDILKTINNDLDEFNQIKTSIIKDEIDRIRKNLLSAI